MRVRADGGADPCNLAVDYLQSVRRGEASEAILAQIRELDPGRLAGLSDAAKTAFWINLYNANVQDRLADDPDSFDRKWRFFRADAIPVAGRSLSLDDIEHGLLRRSRFRWGLGYLPNPFAGGFKRRLRVSTVDPRIHFALNCGAASCPPIAFYTTDDLDGQLSVATAGYLESTVEYDAERGIVRVPRLMLWYRGDFGGKRGILELLREHDLLPKRASPRLNHRSYDWSLSLGDFRDHPSPEADPAPRQQVDDGR